MVEELEHLLKADCPEDAGAVAAPPLEHGKDGLGHFVVLLHAVRSNLPHVREEGHCGDAVLGGVAPLRVEVAHADGLVDQLIEGPAVHESLLEEAAAREDHGEVVDKREVELSLHLPRRYVQLQVVGEELQVVVPTEVYDNRCHGPNGFGLVLLEGVDAARQAGLVKDRVGPRSVGGRQVPLDLAVDVWRLLNRRCYIIFVLSTVINEPLPGEAGQLPADSVDLLADLGEDPAAADDQVGVVGVEADLEDVEGELHRVLLLLVVDQLYDVLRVAVYVLVPGEDLGVVVTLHALDGDVDEVLVVVREQAGRLLRLDAQAPRQGQQDELQGRLRLTQVLPLVQLVQGGN